MPSSKPLKIKPSEVAADTKKKLIPEVNRHFREEWPPYSVLYSQPLLQLPLSRPSFISSDLPKFYVVHSDPVDCALGWAQTEGVRIPFICAANEKRPGGDWETGVVGYEV
ncbi:mitochondrial chaperone bcs1 [Colletotrichum higginsianum]|nr:mitochondrial chaperone bcs1 [Colletotrichum higginsianum]